MVTRRRQGPPDPEEVPKPDFMAIKDIQTSLLGRIRTRGAIEVPLNDLRIPPADIKFTGHLIEDAILREMLLGESDLVVDAGPKQDDVVGNLKAQLEFYRNELQPHLTSASTGVQAVEVFHTKRSKGQVVWAEKFVLDRNGDITKVTGTLGTGLFSKRTVKLTPENEFHVHMERKAV